MSVVTRWFDDISIQQKLFVCFSIPVLLMLAVSSSVYRNTQSMVEDNDWVAHTHLAIARAQELLTLVVDMETGLRGYLITGDNSFLEPYESASNIWRQRLMTLQEQVDDNPPQVQLLKNIGTLHNQWLMQAGMVAIDARKEVTNGTASMDKVIYMTKSQVGKKIIDEIRAELARFIEVERKLIVARIIESRNSANTTTLVIFLGTIITGLISIAVTLWASNRISKRIYVLLEATKQVAKGKLNEGAETLRTSVNNFANDEVAMLTHSFRSMTDNLIDSEQKNIAFTNQLKLETDKTAAAAKSKSNFLSTMSHEIRTPMNGVLGLAQIIASETKEPSTKENIGIILESGQHLVTILNDILDFSKAEENKLTLEKTPFPVSSIMVPVSKTIQPMADEKNLQFIVQNEVPESIEVIGDSARLRQILFNLLGNSVKFTHNGRVVVQTKLDTTNSQLHICVSDTGIGIPLEQQDSIFNSFEQADTSTTRKYGGTGLGLAIVNKLTEAMGGTIDLDSQEGLGTRFTLMIPMDWQAVSSNALTSSIIKEPDVELGKLKILLTEDNQVNALVAKSFCENLGHQVDIAENGLLATEILKDKSYDLIIMDNHMPKMNGIEATRYIRNVLKLDTVIFAYTADVFREAHDGFIEAGAHHILTKPLQVESFVDALKLYAPVIASTSNCNQTISNVIHLHRNPIEKLKTTEEELTGSATVQLLVEEPATLIELLETATKEIDDSVDLLISAYEKHDCSSLHKTLHSIKGMALNLNLNSLAKLALELELVAKDNELPHIESLQVVINKLQINMHQGHRMLESVGQQSGFNKVS